MLTISHKQTITDSVLHWIDEKNPARSGNKLAEKAGVSSAYVSKIKNGEYEFEVNGHGRTTSISDATFHRIAEALGIRFDGQLHWDFLSGFKLIQRVCRKAQKKAIREIVDGWTGQGKTYSLEHYAVTNDYVVYVKCTQNMSAKGLLDAILDRLGVHDVITGNHNKLELIKKVVTNRKGFLIIIDEVEVVKPGIYAVLKDISDFTHNKCGFIISGMELIKKLQNLAGRHKAGFPQLKRRFFGNQVFIPQLTQGEIVAVCEYEKIANKGAQSVLAKSVHDLDMLSQYVADIKDEQERLGKKLTGEEVVQLLNIPV